MGDVKLTGFVAGVPLYRQVQDGIEDLIRSNPPAKEIMPGFCVTVSRSRIAELVMPLVRSA